MKAAIVGDNSRIPPLKLLMPGFKERLIIKKSSLDFAREEAFLSNLLPAIEE